MEALGAGELLLNCIDRDGQGTGYELELINQAPETTRESRPRKELASEESPHAFAHRIGA